MNQYLQIIKHIIDQITWHFHSQRNEEKTATAKLEIVMIVKMKAKVANACTHLNQAMTQDTLILFNQVNKFTWNYPITKTIHLVSPKPEAASVRNL